ncbi:hypothetical protein BDQ17DRAFT_1422423 [Cyathus striatus]|nr:hypothetical protein BDQ17DRAFT_1422423 [Cyathus striatus]
MTYKETNSIMDKFLLKGKLNPAIMHSKTTGKSNMLANLFKYLKISYMLPSDTAVHNELAKIFAELHGKVVEELAYFSAIAMDNASVNDVFFRNVVHVLLTLYDILEHEDWQIRCLAHIINLVAQAILSALDEAEECTEDSGESDHFLMNKNMPIHYNIEDDAELQELEANRDINIEFKDDSNTAKGPYERELDEEEMSDLGRVH